MKRVLVFFLAGLLATSLFGCSSGSSKSGSTSTSSSSSKANSKNDNTGSSSVTSKASDTKNPDVNVQSSKTKLIGGWPSEIPLINGTITYSASANVIGADSKPTGELQFTTSIDTSKTNKEIHDFYKSKLTKVTHEGSADDSRSYCAGIVGKWEMSVSSIAKDKDNGVNTVTIGVQPKK
jgi:hypothetical protein